ncbi:unnamed protein product [Sphagnum compactum]
MQMRLTTLAKVATFRQGNRYILRTLLSAVSAIERGKVNWAEWFKEQAYPLTKAVQEGGVLHNDVQEDEEVQELVTFQPNSQDQQFTKKLQNTSMVDASHEENFTKPNEFIAKNVQPNSVGDPNEVWPNSEVVLVTQSMSTGITTNRQANKVVQPNSVGMFVKYEALGFAREGGIDPIQPGDVEYGSFPTLDYYREGTRVEHSLEHEDSMEE